LPLQKSNYMGILVKKIDLKPGLRIHHTAEPDHRFRTFADWYHYIYNLVNTPQKQTNEKERR